MGDNDLMNFSFIFEDFELAYGRQIFWRLLDILLGSWGSPCQGSNTLTR